MTPTHSEIKRRYQDLEVWANAYTAQLEAALQSQTQWTRIHCFVMDQFQEAYADEHLSRDQQYVFISLRVALDFRDLDAEKIGLVKKQIVRMSPAFKILGGHSSDKPGIIDLDWQVSERERADDEGKGFADRVTHDVLLIAQTLEQR